MQARLEAILHRKSAEESTAILDGLIQENPEDTFPQVARAMLMIKGKDRSAVTTELRRIAAVHEDDAYVQQVLAGVLGCDVETWGEAWERYQAALRRGPLLSTTYKGAAYYLAKRYEPSSRDLILKDASEVEKMVIRSRLRGYQFMYYSVVIPAMIAALVGSKVLGLGLILMVLAALWGSWCAFTNFYVGCWKCFTAWIIVNAFVWVIFGASAASSSTLLPVVVLIVIVIQLTIDLSRTGQRRSLQRQVSR